MNAAERRTLKLVFYNTRIAKNSAVGTSYGVSIEIPANSEAIDMHIDGFL